MNVSEMFTHFAAAITRISGRPLAFALACGIVVVWALSGPLFDFSDNWELVINTLTTIVTFLMVFLIQNAQNRDSAAIHAKLDELLRSLKGPRNTFVGIENLTEEQLSEIIALCEREAEEERENPAVTQHLRQMHATLSRLHKAKASA